MRGVCGEGMWVFLQQLAYCWCQHVCVCPVQIIVGKVRGRQCPNLKVVVEPF